MLIGIDGNEANEVRRDIGVPTGVNVYAFELLRSIHKLSDEWKGKYSIVIYLKNPPSPLLPKATEHFKYKVLGGGGMWVITKLTPYLFMTADRPDILLSPSHYAPPIAPMPKVVSIMDLGYLRFSGHLKRYDFWQLKYWTAISILTSSKVFAISESTKEDIVRHYPTSLGKVVVTHLGYDPKQYNTSIPSTLVTGIKAKYSIGRDYVLYLGALKPSKNVSGLLHAWAKIMNNFPKYSLVIAGKKGWFYNEIFENLQRLKLTDKVIFTDYVKEEDKAPLIAGAKLFVLPSFWEGFGLDALNAMACGTPIALSRVGSLPEVAGSAGTFFDPSDSDDIAAKIKKVLSLSKVDYTKLVRQSLTQAKNFSWEDMARKTLKVIESIK